jgi:FixJ family two-component response regulator
MAGDGERVVAVVDDDFSVLRSLTNLFSSAGLRAETYESAEAFLASSRLANTGCLVLDLHMPGMSGLELFARLKQADSRIPVVVLTARHEESVRARLLSGGAVAFLVKPFRAGEVLVAVQGALDASLRR